VIQHVLKYIVNDWKSHPVRLVLELLNWLGNVTVSTICVFTVPHPPMLLVYPIWFMCIFISIYSTWSRGSFGLLMAALSVLSMDSIGYARLLLGN